MTKDGRRIGFTFLSPIGKQRNTHWRQSCFVEKLTSREQWALFTPVHGKGACVQGCNPDFAWTITDGIENTTFETMTVKPSLDGSAGGLWHGYITNGEIT